MRVSSVSFWEREVTSGAQFPLHSPAKAAAWKAMRAIKVSTVRIPLEFNSL